MTDTQLTIILTAVPGLLVAILAFINGLRGNRQNDALKIQGEGIRQLVDGNLSAAQKDLAISSSRVEILTKVINASDPPIVSPEVAAALASPPTATIARPDPRDDHPEDHPERSPKK